MENHFKESNFNYSDARLVLREMMRREHWPEFIFSLGEYPSEFKHSGGLVGISIDYILDDTGLLLTKALEWMRGK
jgi:hypothetical protein